MKKDVAFMTTTTSTNHATKASTTMTTLHTQRAEAERFLTPWLNRSA